MIAPSQLEKLSLIFDGKMRELENSVMRDIVRRIAINGEITRSADWQIKRLYELGETKTDIEKAIEKYLNISYEEVLQMYSDVCEEAYIYDKEVYNLSGKNQIPFSDNAELQKYISVVATRTDGEMKNLSKSLGFIRSQTVDFKDFAPITQFYRDTIDNAINGVATGVFDYNTAIKNAVKEMTNSGLRTVDYESGYSSRVDTAVRRAVMTGFSQMVAIANEQNAEQLGTDYFETEWHLGARPTHRPWQGRVYTREQLVSVCGLGRVDGLCGINCYHTYYPFIPGISKRTYTDEQLAELNKQAEELHDYNGKKYTIYDALQRQRKLERVMRAERQTISLLKEGKADKTDIQNAQAKYRATSAEYTRFSEALGMPQQRARVLADGLGRV